MKTAADEYGDELSSEQIVQLFRKEYIDFVGEYQLLRHRFTELNEADGSIHSRFEGEIAVAGEKKSVVGVGNGPIDEWNCGAGFAAFFDVGKLGVWNFFRCIIAGELYYVRIKI